MVLALTGFGCGPFGSTSSRRVVAAPPPPQPHQAPPPIPYDGTDAAVDPLIEAEVETALHTPEIDDVIEEAEVRFEAGENFYREGDPDLARRLFDEAIDVLLTAPRDAFDWFRVREKCDELVDAIHAFDIDGLGASGREPGYEASPLDEVLAVTFPTDPNAELTLADELKLANSEFPLEVNGYVLRYIQYFSGRGRRTLVNGLERLGQYRPMIQRILDEEGVPRELMYLPLVESGYQARALSRKRAAGLWQFTPIRAKEYGLLRTSSYDDRLDPEKATRAAARHLRDLYEQLGDWYLALAAYNSGPGRVTRATRRTGYADYWEFLRRKVLPRETRNYVPIMLAAIVMANNPAEYGLEDVVADPPVEYNTICVTAATHLGLLADILEEPIETLHTLNPSLLTDVAPAGYSVHVPKGTAGFVVAALENVPASRRSVWRVHHVGDGETLQEIAQRYETTTEQLHVANGGALTDPEAGDLVVIPVGEGSGAPGAGIRSNRQASSGG